MELFNEMFSVDCINPVDNATELDAKHFLRIGSLYLWVQRRSAPSTPHAHAYFRGVRRVKAGMTSPDERDRRLYEKYSLCDYELPFVCLVLSEQKKNSFTIVLHDHRGTLAREDRQNDVFLRQFESSLQPSQLPTPVVEEGELVDSSKGLAEEGELLDSPKNAAENPMESPMELTNSPMDSLHTSPQNSPHTPAEEGEQTDFPTVLPTATSTEDESPSGGQWESFVLSRHLVEIQKQLELQLFQAKNKKRMQTLLERREMDSTALVDATRCGLRARVRRRPDDPLQTTPARAVRRPVLSPVPAAGDDLRHGAARERALAAAAPRGRPQRPRRPAHPPRDGLQRHRPRRLQRALRSHSPATAVAAGDHRRTTARRRPLALSSRGGGGGRLAAASASMGLGFGFGGQLRHATGAGDAKSAAVSAGASPAVVRGGGGLRGVAADARGGGEQVAAARGAGGDAGEFAGGLRAGRVSVAVFPRAGGVSLRGAASRGDGGDGGVSAATGESVRAT